MEKTRLTKLEKYWILYDVGNSAFILLVSTIIPIYFDYLAGGEGLTEVQYLAYWGYAASFSTVIVAFLGPIVGTIADTKGFKKRRYSRCFLQWGCWGAPHCPFLKTGSLSWLCLS